MTNHCQSCIDGAAETLGRNPVPAHEVGWWCWMFRCDSADDCRCWETLATALHA